MKEINRWVFLVVNKNEGILILDFKDVQIILFFNSKAKK